LFIFPGKMAESREIYVLCLLRIHLPRSVVDTGYGVKIVEKQGSDHFIALAEENGFEVVTRKDASGWFYLEMKKPA